MRKHKVVLDGERSWNVGETGIWNAPVVLWKSGGCLWHYEMYCGFGISTKLPVRRAVYVEFYDLKNIGI